VRTVEWFFWFDVEGKLTEFDKNCPLTSLPTDGYVFGLFLHDDDTARNIQGQLLYYAWMHPSGEIAVGQTLAYDTPDEVVQREITALRRRYPTAHIMRGRDVPDGMMKAAEEFAEQYKEAFRARLKA
jgi:hypothetical protein